MTDFIHCPKCGSTNIEDTDYDDDCSPCILCACCGWEGDADELVSVEESS